MAKTTDCERSNLDDALEIVAEIERVRALVRELKSAPAHPLYQQAVSKLSELHERLMVLI